MATAQQVEDTAEYIARFSKASELTTEHLWLALLYEVKVPSARVIAEYGGGTYADWKHDWDRKQKRMHSGRRLPPSPSDEDLPRLSGFRRLLLALLAIVVVVVRLVRGHRLSAAYDKLPWTWQALRVRELVRKWGGPRASDGHYQVVLASVPGAHQHMVWRHGPAIAAAGRRELRGPLSGDALQLALAWPARRSRLIRENIAARARRPRASSIAKAVALGALVLRWVVAGIRALLLGSALVLLYSLLAPAVLILNGIRSLVALLTGLSWQFRDGMSYPGGELEVLWADDTDTRGALMLLLLPRAVLFVLGSCGLATALARIQDIGQPVISGVSERPDLLKTLGAPLYLAGDLLGTNGPIRGLAIIASLGALFLSLPTHRELEQVRLVRWSRQLYAQAKPSMLINGAAVMAKVADAVEDFIGWTASPVYVTVHLVPVLVGFFLAAGLARLVP